MVIAKKIMVTSRTGRFEINYKLCPQSAFICSGWVSEQTTIISIDRINLLRLKPSRIVFTER